MSACPKNKILQSFADNELSAAATESAAAHLHTCANCRSELEKIRAANLQTQLLLDSLLPEEIPDVAPGAVVDFASNSPANRTQSAVAFVAGIAACALLAFVILRHNAPPTNPNPAIANSATASHQLASLIPSPQPAAIAPPSVALSKSVVPHSSSRPRRAIQHSPAQTINSAPLDFIPLDDDGPIESGMIVRMDLNASPANSHATHGAKKLPVDVLVDQQGEVRAIRFLNGGAK